MGVRALSSAATGMHAREMDIEVISNNIANLSTTGYKRQRAEFQDLLYQSEKRPGVNSSDSGSIVPTGIQIGLGVIAGGVYRITEQGPLTETKNQYDVAIRGNGYFSVTLPDGSTAYTRSGSFRLSPQQELVTDEGYVIAPGLTIPPQTTNVSINSSGQIYAEVYGQTIPQLVGQLELVDFPNVAGLSARGNNLLLETAASGSPIVGVPAINGMGDILQGWLEMSNVDSISELTRMIQAQRGYETCSKIIQASDEMMQTANRVKS
jgi:flagellar basal-body rod protein FlgG